MTGTQRKKCLCFSQRQALVNLAVIFALAVGGALGGFMLVSVMMIASDGS